MSIPFRVQFTTKKPSYLLSGQEPTIPIRVWRICHMELSYTMWLCGFNIFTKLNITHMNRGHEIYVPWSKVAILGMVIPPLIGNPYNGYINPYYWVDDHPLLYGNNGSLDPGTYAILPTKTWCTIFRETHQIYHRFVSSLISSKLGPI